jgi:hypothetical protein
LGLEGVSERVFLLGNEDKELIAKWLERLKGEVS